MTVSRAGAVTMVFGTPWILVGASLRLMSMRKSPLIRDRR